MPSDDMDDLIASLACYGKPDPVTYVDVEVNDDDPRALNGVMSRAHRKGYVYKETIDVTDGTRTVRLQPADESNVGYPAD